MTRKQQKEENGDWALDKRISLATGINLIQLITIVWFGSSFYTTVTSNQTLNEKRFQEFADQRKTYNEQFSKMQESIMALTINTSAMAKDITTQSTDIKDIREWVRNPPSPQMVTPVMTPVIPQPQRQ